MTFPVRRLRRSFWLPVACALLLCGLVVPLSLASGAPASSGTHWVTTWAASPQVAVPGTLSETGFDNQTVRNIFFTSVGGTTVRVRFTNTFGREPLEIGRAAIGVHGALAGVDGANVPLSFSGSSSVLIPAGAEALSDPVHLTVLPLQDLAVSVFLPQATGPATQHALAQQVNYVAAGDHTLDSSASAFTTESKSSYFVDSIDVLATDRTLGTVVTLGDSITDGYHSSENQNDRWPNDLARRLDGLSGPTLSVADEGISGNRDAGPIQDISLEAGQGIHAAAHRVDGVTRAGHIVEPR